MKTLTLLCLLCLLNFYGKISAQAVNSLILNPSPELTGLGWTGVSIPTDDPFGFYYNPANLGHWAQTNNLSMHFYSKPIGWLNNAWSGLEYSSYAFNAGYNFKNDVGIDLSLGAGFIHSKFNYGSFINLTGNSSENYDSYNAFGLGASVDYYINFSAGISYKRIIAKTSDFPLEGVSGTVEVNTNAIDYGFILGIPVAKLFDVSNFSLSEEVHLKPLMNYSIGYSRLNIGDEVYYLDPSQKDPLPLTARFGHTFSFGLDLVSEKIQLTILNYDLILEADDNLVVMKFFGEDVLNPGFSYQGILGDIKIGKHLIQLKGDNNVVVHKGHAISLMESVKILKGSFRGRGFMDGRYTEGMIVSSRGMFKLLGYITGSITLKFIGDHFDRRYIESTLYADSPIETDFSSVSVSLINFPFF